LAIKTDSARLREPAGRQHARAPTCGTRLDGQGVHWRTLFIMTAEWRKADGITNNLQRLANGPRTGQILTLPVSVPGVGRP